MATCKLMPLHLNANRTLEQALTEIIDYSDNPDKNENHELMSTYKCNQFSASSEFLFTKIKYNNKSGRIEKDPNDVVAYMIRQSFKPGEITPELANSIGYELGFKFTNGEHEFIVSTHTDKKHIHNHIIFNSTKIDLSGKFKNVSFSGRKLMKLSDEICKEYDLSIVVPDKEKEKIQKGEAFKKRISNTKELRSDIDYIITKLKVKDIDEFFTELKKLEYEIKPGKYISVKNKYWKKARRLKAEVLGKGYDYNSIVERIAAQNSIELEADISKDDLDNSKRSHKENNDFNQENAKQENKTSKRKTINERAASDKQEVQKLIKTTGNTLVDKGVGFTIWANRYNTKQVAKAYTFLQQNNITSKEELKEKVKEFIRVKIENNSKIATIDNRIEKLHEIKQHVFNYSKTKDVYAEYKKRKYDRSFYNENSKEIDMHRSAKKYFDGLDKIPKVKEINEDIQTLLSKKLNFKEMNKGLEHKIKTYQNTLEIFKEIFKDKDIQNKENSHEL